MTVQLSVKDVRETLTHAGPLAASGVGDPASLLLGTVFHQVFADLISVKPERSGLRVIAEGASDPVRRREQLFSHTWTRLLAPRLLKHSTALGSNTAAVISCWHAVRNLCVWLETVCLELLSSDESMRSNWERLSVCLESEVPLSCELREPGWSEPVQLVGIADSLLRVPTKGALCALEIKLGQARPNVDLAQAALYHLILERSGRLPPKSALCLMRFAPKLEELLVDSAQLQQAKRTLLALIATMASVNTEAPNINQRTSVDQGDSVEAPPPNPGLEELGKRLQRAYRQQGVGIEFKAAPEVGARFIRFTVRIGPGARIAELRTRAAEVQHHLELNRTPMIVQVAGKTCIDVERPDPATVPFASVVNQLRAPERLVGNAQVPIGVDTTGKLKFADLGSSGRSHLFVAGTTGSGKSEWLRMALAGLIASNTPETLRLITLDPKLAAFNDLEKSPFLWNKNAWWIPGCGRESSELFADLVDEMDRRYALIRQSGADTLREHVLKTQKPLPRLVCVCDEYYALVSQHREEKVQIEEKIGLIGAKGRACGIHLILATQQPSRRLVGGAIQANLTCRVALYLQEAIESRMILSTAGAEQLTGSGDLFYKDFGDPIRLQAPYLTPEERILYFSGNSKVPA